MVRPKEELNEEKEEKKHALSTLCCVSHAVPFCHAIMNPSFSGIARKLLALIIFHSFMWTEEELIDDLSATKSEIRKLKTLAL